MIIEKEFNYLMKLLQSKDWPPAVLSFQRCRNFDFEKTLRAQSIVDFFIDDCLRDKKFLDFGCGEGHVVKYSLTLKTSISVGYDLSFNSNWNNIENCFFSSNFKAIQNRAPYDIILLYDVIDHYPDPVSILREARSLLSDFGVIYLRCHPWCGRHGAHFYNKINKAFMQLVFSKEELEKINLKSEKNKVLYPIDTYNQYIKTAGFEIIEPEIDMQDVEDFFIEDDLIRSRILKNFNCQTWTRERPEWQMSQCFLDYKLKADTRKLL